MEIDMNENSWATPCPKYDCRKTACKCGLEYVNIPTSLGDDSEDSNVAPKNGAYCNALVVYEANNHVYIYSKEGVPTLIDVDASDISTLEQEVIKAQKDVHEFREDIDRFAYFFDTVADMRTSDQLQSGDYARTLGYYNKNDGGGAYYKVSSTQPSGYYETLGNMLYAELILEDAMNVKQFGAKGDGATDDTAKIQSALDSVSTVMVPTGTYMINAVTHINMNTGNKLILDNEGEIKAFTTSSANYAVIRIENVQDVTIIGGKITGERDTHTGTTGQWGMCIDIRNSSNIILKNIYISNPWGDGVFIYGVEGLYTQNLFIKNARRNGVSVISASNYTSLDDTIEDVFGDLPASGIDFEPDFASQSLKNIKITNLVTRRAEKHGILITLHNLDETSDVVDIEINGYKDFSSPDGVHLTKNANSKGNINLNNVSLYDNPVNPISLLNFTWGQNFILKIDGLYIKRSSADGENQDYAAIYTGGAYGPMGGVILKNTAIYQDGVASGVPDMYLNSCKGISIISPLHKTKLASISNIEDFHVSDPLHTYSLTNITGAGAVGSYDMRTRSVKNAAAGSEYDTTVDISRNAPIGFYCQFINANTTNNYLVQLPSDHYCRALSNDAGVTIVLSPGATITLEKIDSTNIVPTAQSGTITVTPPTP